MLTCEYSGYFVSAIGISAEEAIVPAIIMINVR